MDGHQGHLWVTQGRQEGRLRAPGRLTPSFLHRSVHGHTFTHHSSKQFTLTTLPGHGRSKCFKSVPLSSRGRPPACSVLQNPLCSGASSVRGCQPSPAAGFRTRAGCTLLDIYLLLFTYILPTNWHPLTHHTAFGTGNLCTRPYTCPHPALPGHRASMCRRPARNHLPKLSTVSSRPCALPEPQP